MKQPKRTTVIQYMVMVVAIWLPCRYLWPLRANFDRDWYNNKWTIAYFGEYLRQHWVLPDVLNTTQWAGNPSPLFYGNLAFPLLAPLSSLLTPDIVIRITALLLFTAQYYCVAKALRELKAPIWLANLTACLVIWATYPLSNLFNRNALMEFFATSLLVCALSLAILLVQAGTANDERRYASRMMLCLVIAAGTHPITAMFGIPFFGITAALLWAVLRKTPERMRSILTALLPGCAGAILCLSAWVYATAEFADQLHIRLAQPGVLFSPEDWDRWQTRFYPIPFDSRIHAGTPLSEVWVPYLDPQINMPLLILFLTISVTAVLSLSKSGSRRAEALAAVAVSWGMFAFFTWISLSPESYAHLPRVLRAIQFAYRAVTYQNLSLLLGLFLILLTLYNRDSSQASPVFHHRLVFSIAAACLLLSAYGVTVKWTHIRAARTNRVARTNTGAESSLVFPSRTERQELIKLPDLYYALLDYTTPGAFVPLADEEEKSLTPVAFELNAMQDFGATRPLQLVLPAPAWVKTNALAFPWNRIAVDGQPVSESDIRTYQEGGIALRLPAGTHRLDLTFRPDRTWRILRLLSLLSLFAWVFAEIMRSCLKKR